MSATTQDQTRVWKVLDRGVMGFGLVWVFVALYYASFHSPMDPVLIRRWIIVQFVLAVAHIALSVKARGK